MDLPPSPAAVPPPKISLLNLIQVGQISEEELELRLRELRRLAGPFPPRDELVRQINQSRGRVPWAFNSFIRQQLTTEIQQQQQQQQEVKSHEKQPGKPLQTPSQNQNEMNHSRPGESLAGTSRSIPTAPLPLLQPRRARGNPGSKRKEVGEDSQEGMMASSSSLPTEGTGIPPSSLSSPPVIEPLTFSTPEVERPLPDELIHQIFQFLGTKDLLRVATVCRQFYRLSNDDFLWKRLFGLRWISSPDHALSNKLSTWKISYMHRYLNELHRCCPKPGCPGGNTPHVVVPIIYGFPSFELIEAMRQDKVVIGADHIPVDDWKMSIWGCISGKHAWKEYPWL